MAASSDGGVKALVDRRPARLQRSEQAPPSAGRDGVDAAVRRRLRARSMCIPSSDWPVCGEDLGQAGGDAGIAAGDHLRPPGALHEHQCFEQRWGRFRSRRWHGRSAAGRPRPGRRWRPRRRDSCRTGGGRCRPWRGPRSRPRGPAGSQRGLGRRPSCHAGGRGRGKRAARPRPAMSTANDRDQRHDQHDKTPPALALDASGASRGPRTPRRSSSCPVAQPSAAAGFLRVRSGGWGRNSSRRGGRACSRPARDA